MISNIQFLILTQLQPATPPPPTTSEPTLQPVTPGPTTLCSVPHLSVTDWYYSSLTGCSRGAPDGVTYPTLSACCPEGDRCCDPCDSSICVNGPTPPPTTVSSCTFTLF